MSTPLSLRLWCLAAMAPALTEAAPQARVRTPVSASSTDQALLGLNGRNSPPTLDLQASALKNPLPPKVGVPHVGLPKDLLQARGIGVPVTRISQPATSTAPQTFDILKSLPASLYKPELLSGSQSLVTSLPCKLVVGGMNNTTPATSRVNGAPSTATSTVSSVGDASHGQPVAGTTEQACTSGGSLQLNGMSIKAADMGFTSKEPSSQPAESTSTAESSAPSMLDLNNEELQVQEVCESTLLMSADMQSSSAGMAEVGVLDSVDLVAETTRRQKEMEKKVDRLLRRLRRLQSRTSITHVQKQLSGLVDHQHANLQTMARSMKTPPATNVELKTELLQKEDVKNLSTAALVNLVRRLQSSQNALSLRQRLTGTTTPPEQPASILKLDEDLCIELNRVASTLQMNLHHIETAVDSDATESSSGGESCDEDYDYDDEKIPRIPLQRRAENVWACGRGAVGARWAWLQAQVSDLEYRIRQHTDIYRQIRAAKGPVVLGEPPQPHEILTNSKALRTNRKLTPLEEKIANLERKNIEMSPCNLSTLLSNVDKQSSRLTQQLGNVYSPAGSPMFPNRTCLSTTPKLPNPINGYVDAPNSNNRNLSSDLGRTDAGEDCSKSRTSTNAPFGIQFDPPSPPVDNSCQAARCRPVKSYGKRKLLRTAGLHQVNRKAARLSTVRCGCYPPLTMCSMCGGRYNNTVAVDTYTQPTAERVALIDPSFHPVLSFREDISLPTFFESLLKTGDWQHKAPPRIIKPLHTDRRRKLPGEHVRKYNRKLSKSTSAVVLSSAKIRNKYEHKQLIPGRHPGSNNVTLSGVPPAAKGDLKLRKRKTNLHALDALRKKRRSMSVPNHLNEGGLLSASNSWSNLSNAAGACDPNSPLSAGLSSSGGMQKEASRRRRGESAFDINNIVIPYSMAASTRVEKLQYKEIITPKWRVLTEDELTQASTMAGLSDTSMEQHTNEETPQSSSESLPDMAAKEPESVPDVINGEVGSESAPAAEVVNGPKNEVPLDADAAVASTASDVIDKEADQPAPLTNGPITTNGLLTPESDKLGEKSAGMGTNGLIIPPVKSEAAVIDPDMIEDLSEEIIAMRHLRCEIAEKKKFSSHPTNSRRRGPRQDSIASSVSLDPVTPDTDLALSALHTPPGTPAAAVVKDEVPALEEIRPRTESCSSLTLYGEEQLNVNAGRGRSDSVSRLRTRSGSMGEERVFEFVCDVDPWEKRTFPLGDDQFKVLFQETPVPKTERRTPVAEAPPKEPSPVIFQASTPDASNPTSPVPSSASSEVIDEDPNDPEWTVIAEGEQPPAPKPKVPGLVLKLAKR